MKKFDVIVIGAGAAGLMCAIEAGKRGRSVLVLEKADKIMKLNIINILLVLIIVEVLINTSIRRGS